MSKDLDSLYKALLLSMEQEYEYYRELLDAMQKEATALKRCDSRDILEFNTRNEKLLLSLRVATERRMSAVSGISSKLQIDEPVSMTELIAYAQKQTRQDLIDYQEKFADVIVQIEKTNNRNKELIQASLTHINNTINYINCLTSKNPNYDQRGQIRAGNLQGRLISQAG
jgi:flagellar biosynthesis/type III secretory pathway chaperone